MLPQRVEQRSLVVLPAQDRIVPPKSSAALAALLPAAERLAPPLGHIGMVVSGRARDLCWTPLIDWLKAK